MVNLFITNRNPVEAANYIIKNTDKLFCFKQLIELGQLICSCEVPSKTYHDKKHNLVFEYENKKKKYISNAYKPINQGKAIQQWIITHDFWVYAYFMELLKYCKSNFNFKPESLKRLEKISLDMEKQVTESSIFTLEQLYRIEFHLGNIIFRYKKDYSSFTEFRSNNPIKEEVGIKEYKKYIKWKMQERN